ncbi:MAG: hypothetical protein LBC96_05735 [Lachnospiraceae bacterium]|jgi:hypothetical protein|nr:hypothetical protein [Lachnospiraceae bacterium]
MLTRSKKAKPPASKGSSDGGYYYSRLSDEQKRVYLLFLSCLRNFSPHLKISMRPLAEFSLVFNAILLDNPMLFYVSSYTIASDLYKKKCFITPVYDYTYSVASDFARQIKKCMSKFDVLIDKSELDKELYVHDYCLENLRYDNSHPDHAHSLLGPVLHHAAVCDGISRFAKCAFDYLGVKSLVVGGKAKNPLDMKMERHAWNIVRIGGKTYHLDITFDMTIMDKIKRYDYFNLPDKEIKKDHVIIDEVPKCDTSGNDYYATHQMCVDSINDLERYLEKELKQGKKHITVKIRNVPYSDDITQQVVDIARQQYIRLFNNINTIEVTYNSEQMVYEIMFM